MIKRKATAHWTGDLKTGQGTLTTDSTVLQNAQYSFKTRFQDGIGTNPEELLAAAHAGCFTMAVSMMLGQAGFVATALDTTAAVHMDGPAITGVHLSITGVIPTISAEAFTEITKKAEQQCLISKVLSIPITSDATLH
jgi:osmotically inducible protein OsmC